jgi:hypothetical protein
MRCSHLVASLAASLLLAAAATAQPIIAQLSGLANPDRVIDFGANLYPNFTPVSTEFSGLTLTHASYFTNNYNNVVGGFLTNNFGAGAPNTLRIQFATPIQSLSFVYHQIGTWMPSSVRALYQGVVVDSFSNSSNQTQPNNYFGFTNILFDELQLDFVGDFNVDTLAIQDGGASCTFRNGLGINLPDLSCTTLPVVGTNWISTIRTNASTVLAFLALAPGGPLAGAPLLGGELLVQTTPSPFVLSGSGVFSVGIPNTSLWVGYALSTQGFRLDILGGSPTFLPLNALDVVMGR